MKDWMQLCIRTPSYATDAPHEESYDRDRLILPTWDEEMPSSVTNPFGGSYEQNSK